MLYLYCEKEEKRRGKEVKMKCCICKEEIGVEANGWDRGNNALPVKDGRCCNECNWSVVIFARLKGAKVGGAK